MAMSLKSKKVQGLKGESMESKAEAVHKNKDGKQTVICDEKLNKPIEFAAETELARVNVHIGGTIGLENYSNVKIGCSLTLPCPSTDSAMETAYAFAEEWCFRKMDELTEKALKED